MIAYLDFIQVCAVGISGRERSIILDVNPEYYG